MVRTDARQARSLRCVTGDTAMTRPQVGYLLKGVDSLPWKYHPTRHEKQGFLGLGLIKPISTSREDLSRALLREGGADRPY